METKVTAVVAYPDRARVTRRGTAALEAGVQRLEIPNLPARLDPDSVRVQARGTARARLLGVQMQVVFSVGAPVEEVRALEVELDRLKDEIRLLEARSGRLQENRAALTSLAGQPKTYAMALAAGEMTVENQIALFEGLWGRAGELDAELLTVSKDKRELERQVQKVKSELDRWRGAPHKEQYTANVDLDVSTTGDLSIEISYVVRGAGWKPLYDLRLDEDGDEPNLNIEYLAQVSQRTGEAWPDVTLTLSTARPALAGRLPELEPWFISPVETPPVPVMRAAPANMRFMKASQGADSAAMMAESESEMDVSVAAVEAGGAVVNYRVSGLVSVPGDGAPHKVTVAQLNMAPKLDYVTAPNQVEAVYRRAQLTNESPYTFLPGSANLFAGDEYLGTFELEMASPEETIEIYLGVDDRIQVKRELKRREVDKRLIGNRRHMHYAYEVTLENLMQREVRINLHDQIPVGRHEDLKVHLDSANPRPSEHTELNLLCWELSLAAHEKRVVRFDFTVDSPVQMQVAGLP